MFGFPNVLGSNTTKESKYRHADIKLSYPGIHDQSQVFMILIDKYIYKKHKTLE